MRSEARPDERTGPARPHDHRPRTDVRPSPVASPCAETGRRGQWGTGVFGRSRSPAGADDPRRTSSLIGPLPADPCDALAARQQGQLPHQFGIRHQRPGNCASASPSCSGSPSSARSSPCLIAVPIAHRHRAVPDEVRAAAGCARPSRILIRPVGRGTLDRVRRSWGIFVLARTFDADPAGTSTRI